MKKFFLIFPAFLFVTFAFWPQAARAQMCDTLFEVITTLRPPTFGFPTVWDAKYGIRDSLVQLGSGVAVEGGTVFAIGRRLSSETFQPEEIVLVEINRRGRALKEERYPARDGEQPVKMIDMGNEYVAISNMRGGPGHAEKWARLSWYDKEGRYKREKILQDSRFDFTATGLVRVTTGQDGFIAVLHAVNREEATDQNGVLIRFTPGGEQLWRRAYRPGVTNVINSLVPFDEENYMAAGRIRMDDGRMAGWAMKLGDDGAVHWQRTYPRGAFSAFHHAARSSSSLTAEGRGLLLAGVSKPYDDGPEAAWVMAVDALGEPQWQRYYRRPDYELTGKWVVSEPDGRTVLIIDAKAVESKGGHNHVRMLTLSPRGVLVQDEAYYEGLQARARDYVPGWNGERIITAVIEDDMGQAADEEAPIVVVGLAADEKPPAEDKAEGAAAPPGEEPPQQPEPVHKGWVFVATALDPYIDPCRSFAR